MKKEKRIRIMIAILFAGIGFIIAEIFLLLIITTQKQKIPYDTKCVHVEVQSYNNGEMTNLYDEVIFSDYVSADHVVDGFGERIIIYFNKEEEK